MDERFKKFVEDNYDMDWGGGSVVEKAKEFRKMVSENADDKGTVAEKAFMLRFVYAMKLEGY